MLIHTLSTTVLFLALATGSAQADLVFQMDFNDAAGNSSLADRGTTGTTGGFTGGAGFSKTVAPSNTGGFSSVFYGSGNDSVNFGDVEAVDGLTAFTITAWIRPDKKDAGGPSNSGRIVMDRPAGAGPNGFDFYYHDVDDELELVAGGVPINGGGDFDGAAWTFVAVTYDGNRTTNNVKFYTGDGTTLSAADTATINKGPLAGNNVPLIIGNVGAGNRSFDGLIDNVRIYNSVEDPASLKRIMQFDDSISEPGSPAPLTAGAAPPSKASNDQTLSVVAYNVQFGDRAIPEDFAKELAPLKPDVVLLNEVPGGDWTQSLAKHLGLEHSYLGKTSSANHKDKYRSVISRTPIENPSEILLKGRGWNPASTVRVETVINGKRFALYSLHISGFHRSSTDYEGTQANDLFRRVLAEEKLEHVIVGGDFNDTMTAPVIAENRKRAGYRASWDDLDIDLSKLKSCDTTREFSLGVIDHIFYRNSGVMRAVDGRLLIAEDRKPLSDHWAVWAKLKINSKK